MQGMAWGHLPRFLIENELRDGRLLSLAGRHFPGIKEDLVVARRTDRPHGPIAAQLWSYLHEQAPLVRDSLTVKPVRKPPPGARPTSRNKRRDRHRS